MRSPALQAGFLRQQRGEAAADTVALFVALMQLTNMFVIFQDMPVTVVVAQLARFKGKREGERAGIIVSAHRRHNQVMPVSYRARLHIGDQLRNGLRLQKHHHHGGEHKGVAAVETRLIQIALLDMNVGDAFLSGNLLKTRQAGGIVIPGGDVKAVLAQKQAVAAVAAAKIERFAGIKMGQRRQYFRMGRRQAIGFGKIVFSFNHDSLLSENRRAQAPICSGFFFQHQLPAGDFVPVGLFTLQIELHQVVLAEIARRERQRPVAFVGRQLQRVGTGGRLTLIIE